MNAEMTLPSLRELCVFDADGGPDVRGFYERSLATMALPAADYLCIRDLLALSGLAGCGELHALLLVMFDAVSEGSLCISTESGRLAVRLARVLPPKRGSVALAGELLHGLESGAYDTLIASDTEAYVPLLWNGSHL